LQKFGLDSLQTGKLNALELEIAKEKATALGIAGKKLEDSIATYKKAISRPDIRSEERDQHLAEVSANVSALIIQRELVGLVHENMPWVIQNYEIPDEALAVMGASRD
jgi:hypothetical protein